MENSGEIVNEQSAAVAAAVVVADTKKSNETANSKEEEDEDTLPSNAPVDPTTLLPNELWVRIFSFYTAQSSVQQLLPLRLVHPIWRNLIDEHFTFSVVVHDDRSDFSDLPKSLKIKDCLIAKLTNPPPSSSQRPLFNHPEYLRRVRFWGPIHPPTFFKILRSATNLEDLFLTRHPLAQCDLFDSVPTKIILNKLTKLEILGHCCFEVSELVKTNFQLLLQALEVPNLHRIFVNIMGEWRCIDEILIVLILYVSKHRNHLTHINASLVPTTSTDNGSIQERLFTPPEIDQRILQQLYDDSFQLESLRLSLTPKYVPVWIPLVQKQGKLRELRLHWKCSSSELYAQLHHLYPNVLNLSLLLRIEQLLPTLRRCAETLVRLELTEVSLSVDELTRQVIPVDLDVLRQARNLKKLVLARNKDDCRWSIVPVGAVTLINVDLQFPCLEELEIVRLTAPSVKLEILIEGTGTSLRTAKLLHTGKENGQGVHAGILMTLMEVPGMNVVNVSPISYSSVPGVDEKLEILRRRFGDGIYAGGPGDDIYRHVHFDFRKWRRMRREYVINGTSCRCPKMSHVFRRRFRSTSPERTTTSINPGGRTRRDSNDN